MTPFLNGLFKRLNIHANSSGDNIKTAAKDELFPRTTVSIDGDECLHDCTSCTIKYPSKFNIEESGQLYGGIKPWSTHLLVGTGVSDWKREVSSEKGSIMEAIEHSQTKITNGKLKVSASNIPVPATSSEIEGAETAEMPTTVLLLPAFLFIDNVTPSNVSSLITSYINPSPTTTSSLDHKLSISPLSSGVSTFNNLSHRPCNHSALIILCSHRTRDARCGQSAPLLQREFERHLRPRGLQRDMDDNRPGGVGIHFVSHVGGHKFSANVVVYRRAGAFASDAGTGSKANGGVNGAAEAAEAQGHEAGTSIEGINGQVWEDAGASQCIWLARVRPEDCENIVRYTVLQGKVVKPDRQLRGGFDRERGLVSW